VNEAKFGELDQFLRVCAVVSVKFLVVVIDDLELSLRRNFSTFLAKRRGLLLWKGTFRVIISYTRHPKDQISAFSV
jgi:hypothetical protein